MAVTTNPIIVLYNQDEWSNYCQRWPEGRFKNIGGKPIRFPCIVTSVTYVDTSNIVKHLFAYEEILLAFKQVCKKRRSLHRGNSVLPKNH